MRMLAVIGLRLCACLAVQNQWIMAESREQFHRDYNKLDDDLSSLELIGFFLIFILLRRIELVFFSLSLFSSVCVHACMYYHRFICVFVSFDKKIIDIYINWFDSRFSCVFWNNTDTPTRIHRRMIHRWR